MTKTVSKPILVIVFLICSIGYGQNSVRQSWENQIQSVLDKQTDSWNRGDIEGYMEGYWKSDSLLFTSGGNIQRGWDATLAKYKKSYSSKEKMGTLKFSNLEFHLLTSDAAWVLGHWQLTRSGDHPNGIFTLIVRKFSDGWKIVHDHTSSLPDQK